MNFATIKYKLQHILQGKRQVSYGESIQAIAGFLRETIHQVQQLKEMSQTNQKKRRD